MAYHQFFFVRILACDRLLQGLQNPCNISFEIISIYGNNYQIVVTFLLKLLFNFTSVLQEFCKTLYNPHCTRFNLKSHH